MRFGMNVKVNMADDGASAIKFISKVEKAGANVVRLSLDGACDKVIKAADALKVRYALAPIEITAETAEADYASLKTGFELWEAVYAGLAQWAKPNRAIGIILPQGLHYLTKTSNKPGAFGLRKDQVDLILSRLISVIHQAGHVAVMPMRLDDAQARAYPLPFDVTEIDTMLSPATEAVMSRAVIEEAVIGRYWLGRAGALGGYVMPAHQMKVLRKLEQVASGAEYAFLWSEEAQPRWSWSRSGEEMLDLHPTMLASQSPINPTGDPARAAFKASQRNAR